MINLRNYILSDVELSDDIADIVSDNGNILDDNQMIQRCIMLNNCVLEDRARQKELAPPEADQSTPLDAVIEKYTGKTGNAELSPLDTIIAKYS